MNDEAPAPLVPANMDLRDFLFTPVEFQRIFSSETWLMCSAHEKVAAITLWGNSWIQLPTGSMPSNDELLAYHSGAGSGWKRVKAKAMRGWILCSDGRYYHPVMCEKALEAWIEKLSQRLSSGAGNAKRWGIEFDPTAITTEILTARKMLEALNPKARALQKKPPRIPDSVPDANGQESQRDRKNIPSGSQETGTGTGNIKPSLSGAAPVDNSSIDDRAEIDGLTDYHKPDWQPDLARVEYDLKTKSGIPMPDPIALQLAIEKFNLSWQGKALTLNDTYARLRIWLTEDYCRGQTQNRSNAPAQGGTGTRKLSAVEQIEAARDRVLGKPR